MGGETRTTNYGCPRTTPHSPAECPCLPEGRRHRVSHGPPSARPTSHHPVAGRSRRSRAWPHSGRGETDPSGELRAQLLLGENPLRETSWVTLPRALHAVGRTAEALQRYEAVRRILAACRRTPAGCSSPVHCKRWTPPPMLDR
ncbi:BTAD domain-containing putative transcriptional regulator [Streptomyces sp. NPDC012403]|uniref:BTAD domain-containing putative transcriptional regulator n=1 Tax=Streptomyces sp. NPDC012403 TaxID=3364831 RepID=UPI0036EE4051